MNYILINISKTISPQNLRNQWSWDANCVSKKINLFLLKNFVCVFDSFDVLISKIIFLKIKNIILMYFSTKNTLKSNRNHTPNQTE
jgi:hypothetical protein